MDKLPPVMPAKAGVQDCTNMDSCFRRNDSGRNDRTPVIRHPSSIVTCVFFLALLSLNVVTAIAQEWQAAKSEHFIVYYLDDKDFAGETAKRAEYYYGKIASDLGYVRYDNFWQWENRVAIYIYSTEQQFVVERDMGPRRPGNWITGYRQDEEFLDGGLPSQLTRLIFKDFMGVSPSGVGGIPLWIYEGLIQWENKFKREQSVKLIKKLVKKNNYIPFNSLMRMDVRVKHDYTSKRIFYAEVITMVGYLMDEHGGKRFALFCRQLRDGKKLNDALFFVYRDRIKNMKEFEKKWLLYYGGE